MAEISITARRRATAATCSLVEQGAIDDLADEWRDLARDAIEANPFFSPWMLGPALRFYGDGHARLLCVRRDGALVGLLPIMRAKRFGRIPISHLSTWLYPHCFYGAPLVRRGAEAAFAAALHDFIDATAPQGAFMHLPLLDHGGAVARSLQAERGRRMVLVSAAHDRAVLRGGYDADAFITANVGSKRRAELRRQRARLEDVAPVTFRLFQPADDIDAWIGSFARLENRGWKAEAGTSFLSSVGGANFLKEALGGAARTGELQMARLDCGTSPVAMIINIGRAGSSYGFKIAHDEAFGRYSPGVLAMLELTRAMETMKPDGFLDSCASADHPMINAIWPERRRIAALSISKDEVVSRALLSLLRGLERPSEARAARRPGCEKSASVEGQQGISVA